MSTALGTKGYELSTVFEFKEAFQMIVSLLLFFCIFIKWSIGSLAVFNVQNNKCTCRQWWNIGINHCQKGCCALMGGAHYFLCKKRQLTAYWNRFPPTMLKSPKSQQCCWGERPPRRGLSWTDVKAAPRCNLSRKAVSCALTGTDLWICNNDCPSEGDPFQVNTREIPTRSSCAEARLDSSL